MSLHSVLRASGDLHFHFINPKTGHRVRTVTLDAETDKEVPRSELARGYEFEKDRYVLLDDEDFASARIDTSSTMTVNKFIARDAIHPIYFDTSYYMVPDGEAGQDVYVVLRDAIAASGTAALSRLVISRRERRWRSCHWRRGWCCTRCTSRAISTPMTRCSIAFPVRSRMRRWSSSRAS